MPSEVPDPAELTSSIPRHDNTSETGKRQRQPSQSSQSPGQQPGDETPSMRGRDTLIRPQGLRGSSRDTADMYRSSTPPERSNSGSIKYTRTGRVSKATKGQRIHHCEECGKTYTRAEHLRRHQQNHKPGAYPCDWPSCGRSFYREDLLVRHKARHNDPLNPPSRRQSIGSRSSSAEFGRLLPGSSQASDSLRATTETSVVAPDLQQETSGSVPHQSSSASRTPKRVPIPPNELRSGVPLTTNGPEGFGSFTNPWEPTPPLSPTGYNYDYESSDEAADVFFYQPQMARARNFSDTSFLGYGQPYSTSRSPVSVGSSTQIQRWSSQPVCETQYFPDAGSLVGSLGYPTPEYTADLACCDPHSATAEVRDLMEHSELNMLDILLGCRQGNEDITPYPMHQQYLAAYWSQVHELFPIIHKPTFDHDAANPLLRAAILALGGQASGHRTDLSNARTIHEKCVKVLKQRMISEAHAYRVCDMQAIVLVEVFSLFKSRRPPLRLSKHFENVYSLLSNDTVAFMSSPSPEMLVAGSFSDELFTETACRQRLLLVCYVLEQQHSTFFGRQPTTCFNNTVLNLPYPTSQNEWDAVAGMPPSGQYERTSQALQDLQFIPEPMGEHVDPFRSMLLMACRFDAPKDLNGWADCCEDFPIALTANLTPRVRLAYHTFVLCSNTPIRDLLAVAGESWILAEKLGTQAEYTAAQIEARQWAARPFSYGEQPPVQEALNHAFAILSVHQDFPKTGLLFQEWATYLAALVIWARVHATKIEEVQPRLSIPTPNVPQVPLEALDSAAAGLILNASTIGMKWNDVLNILLWTRSKIQKQDPHNCGLNSGAVDVLGTIIARGNERGWF
ncbi:hypothetical protein CLAFUR0_04680 [Fulvia fulva]|nr:hypothetical protein CLAFUR0_04680 [Fulvia fulva]